MFNIKFPYTCHVKGNILALIVCSIQSKLSNIPVPNLKKNNNKMKMFWHAYLLKLIILHVSVSHPKWTPDSSQQHFCYHCSISRHAQILLVLGQQDQYCNEIYHQLSFQPSMQWTYFCLVFSEMLS